LAILNTSSLTDIEHLGGAKLAITFPQSGAKIRDHTHQYIEVYYNRVRRHSAIGSIAPEVFENQYKNVA